jgi:hypothetical protein
VVKSLCCRSRLSRMRALLRGLSLFFLFRVDRLASISSRIMSSMVVSSGDITGIGLCTTFVVVVVVLARLLLSLVVAEEVVL